MFEDLHDYMQSLDKILKLEPSKIFPGHGPVIHNPRVKIVEYIQHRLQREEQILDELQKVQPKGLTAEELVNLIYVVSFSFYSNSSMHLKNGIRDPLIFKSSIIIDCKSC